MNVSYTTIVKQLVDDLKSISANAGLGGEAGEYNLVTQSFLYKFLNDKFLFEIKKIHPDYDYEKLTSLSEDDYTMLLDFELGTNAAHLHPRHLIEHLYNHQNEDDFAKTFDDTLNDIAVENNSIFSVHTAGNSDIRLFEERLINDIVRDKSMRNEVAKQIISKLALIKFDETIFEQGFDFFSTIFEYMIKDYNKDGGGKYAEYYTPHSVAKIMAEILIGEDKPKSVKAYDPSAGSGTLLMNVASKIGTDKVSIYSQDISQKSSNLLRMNLILNNLSHSISNIVQGNTITENRYADKKMDYIVSNPPFKLDFSEWREKVATLPEYSERFFAGIPNTPKSTKDKMAIYLLFIQHIIYSLNDTGKAAVVVPTGFITAQSGIEKKIRKYLIHNRWLKGVVSMPSNIFATTGTNVSVIFIDKTNNANDAKVVLVDASKLGKKVKDGKNQKTLLSNEDEFQIIDTFAKQKSVDDFSAVLDYDEFTEKNFSFAAGQYFDIKIEYVNITADEFQAELSKSKAKLSRLFEENAELEKDILTNFDKLNIEID
ncbi:class I SAM-dependent DNA methyltransferase [Enterococcus hulanensis]|uniref:HsdM family class I SAM-dependent methyltransferase n=1 Tax=Enterococcus hulanensis TaxID=2559929 RepID=UPI00288F44A8|nr:class I SAM-dependent DNA methyltransferase [Enterococcus hulanensis]MDT2659246.1 class I SAM-dependent DNA methyltransferase [Enterococcus hulanensis]